jgi:transposase
LSESAPQARWLLAVAQIYDGGSQSEAARTGGVTLQIMRDGVIRFNAHGLEGLLDGKAPGKPSILDGEQRRALLEAVEREPIAAIDGIVRWRLIDLVQRLDREFAVLLDETTVSRELRRLGYVKLTAQNGQHAQNELAMEALKRGLRRRGGKGQEHSPEGHAPRDLAPGRGVRRLEEQDHAPLGQARDAALGAQGPADEIGLHLWSYLPRAGQGAGLILPFCNTDTMSLHLIKISLAVAPGARRSRPVCCCWSFRGRLAGWQGFVAASSTRNPHPVHARRPIDSARCVQNRTALSNAGVSCNASRTGS